jgi:phage shock protein C
MAKLAKSTYDKKLLGVCGGIAERFDMDSTVIRAIFVIGAILGVGSFVLIYLVLAIIMPRG